MSVFYVFSEQPSYIAGRAPESDLVLPGNEISRKHLESRGVTYAGAAVEVLGRNGAHIEGANVNKGYKCLIRSGDRIVVGGHSIVWIGGKIPDPGGFIRGMANPADLKIEPVEIEGPPQRKVPEKPSIMLAAGPALTMAIPILLGAGRLVAVLSTLFAAVWAALNVTGRIRKQKAEEKRRRNTYISYLEQCESIIKTRLKDIRSMLYRMYPEVGDYLKGGGDPFILWNDQTGPDCTLVARIGRGTIQNPLSIATPREHFAAVDDSLKALPGMIKRSYAKIPSSPVLSDLRRKTIAGVVLSDERDRQILAGLILQLACRYPPEVLGIRADISDDEMRRFMWLTILPHYMPGDDGNEQEEGKGILFVTDDNSKAYEAVMKDEYVILACGDASALPSGIGNVINDDGMYDDIRYDLIPQKLCFSYAVQLSRLGSGGRTDDRIPDSVPFGRLFEAITPEKIADEYAVNDITVSFAAPIGIGAGGIKIMLDLHERSAGPHGLIAGTTGSGKSELLTTLILAFAVRYPPDKLAFFLIDYKGGGMSNLFARLPHLIGSISNLSGTATGRAMIALRSENIRRQRIFAASGVNNINDYTKLYDAGSATEPLPHVLVIVDEFAELRNEEPEFMDRLISISQVGRSLGIHLILATQKPSGVVDDKIRSNTGFRIALRLALASDSADMLRRGDAVNIRQCGRAFLQVGNDEVFEMFQSGYSMGYVHDMADAPRIYEDLTLEREIPREGSNDDMAECDELTWYDHTMDAIIKACAMSDSGRPAALFLPPLPEIVTDESAYAIFDDPYEQRYVRAHYRPKEAGNVWIAGRSGCGKSELLYTMLSRISEDAAVYIIDHGGGSLKRLKDLPYCGGYVSDERPDNALRMTAFVVDEMSKRRKYKRSGDIPVILVLDDHPDIVSLAGETARENIIRIMTLGKSVGVYVIATSNSPPSAREGKLADTCMYMGNPDPYAVSDFLRAPARDIPLFEDRPGRGVAILDGIPLEFQAVLERTGRSPTVTYEAVQYPEVPLKATLAGFMERASREVGRDRAKLELPAGYEAKTGRIYTLPTGYVRTILISGRSYSGRHTLLFNISITAATYGIKCVRADTYEALIGILRQSSPHMIITVSNINEILNEFYLQKRTLEEEDELASYLTNSGTVWGRMTRCPVVIGIIDNGPVSHSGTKIYKRLLEHPYGLSLGGSLDENRIFDFSYLPYAVLQKSQTRGYATIPKFDEKAFEGDVIIPMEIDVDNSQTQ